MPTNTSREPWLQIETRTGEPIRARGRTLIPFATSLRLHPPGAPAGLIWNRPTSILVQEPDGQEFVLKIPDLTRNLLWALLGGCALAVLLAWLLRKRT